MEMHIETERLILRKFRKTDIEAIFELLSDKEINTFLPWYPVKTMQEAEDFYERRFSACEENKYCYAITIKGFDRPVGYVKAEIDDSHDFGYALMKEYWHKCIVTEASKALIEFLKAEGLPYITATHDRNNPRSGGVMRQVGMKYCYSYEELWQPKNFPVVFRMYQLNFDSQKDSVYKNYWDKYENHFIEEDL